MTGQFKLSNGSAAAPALTFGSDLDTGLYRIGANEIGIAVNGTKVGDWSTTGMVVTGTLGFSGDFAINTSKFTVASASGNTAIAGTLGVTGAADFTAQVTGSNGTKTVPSYSFTSDPDTGIYRIGANNIGVSCGDTKILDVATTGLTVVGNISATTFTVTAPTVQIFTSGTAATYTTPANCKRLRVRMVAGGGGGGAVTTNGGADGTNSSFDTWTAVKGTGGTNGAVGSGGAGGTAGTDGTGTKIIRVTGCVGGFGSSIGGFGGGTPLGPGAPGFAANAAGVNATTNTGGGGSGGQGGGGSGGGGGGGGEYVEFFISPPAATYTYTVGAGGNGGVAGTKAGGNGAAGIIVVEEYYL